MNKIICGDALTVLRTLPDKSCRCCVTSPPYFNLRDYGVPGQIGLEPTMQEYIARLVEVFAEVKRVLTDDGTLWVNIADSYGQNFRWGNKEKASNKQMSNRGTVAFMDKSKKMNLPAKNLMGIPWRLAFALQDSGWILRQDIIWSKSNCMLESVRDRCTKSHEYIFLFAKRQRYYFNSDAILEPAVGFNNEPIAGSVGAFGQEQSRRRKGNSKTFRGGKYTAQNTFDNSRELSRNSHGNCENNTGKRRMRSVWNMATTASGSVTHYAKFPNELAERCILCGTAEGDIVLDPFVGSGTTCRVANRYGRQYIGIDLNPAYCKAAEAEIPINLF
nr:MAG TPA: adenine-specific methyltransferase [Caudoviricetes sp.]